MRQAATTLQIDTGGRGFYPIGPAVASFAQGQGMRTGLLTLFCRHTSASLLIQENADPSVLSDLENFLSGASPRKTRRSMRTTAKGPTTCPRIFARR